MFNYEQKYAARVMVDRRVASQNPDYLARAREDVVTRAFLSVARESLSEHGVNIKTITHEYVDPCRDHLFVIGAVVLLSHPVEKVVTITEPAPNAYLNTNMASDYICIWCGSKNPKDDIYHSGTCENCGGPKI